MLHKINVFLLLQKNVVFFTQKLQFMIHVTYILCGFIHYNLQSMVFIQVYITLKWKFEIRCMMILHLGVVMGVFFKSFKIFIVLLLAFFHFLFFIFNHIQCCSLMSPILIIQLKHKLLGLNILHNIHLSKNSSTYTTLFGFLPMSIPRVAIFLSVL